MLRSADSLTDRDAHQQSLGLLPTITRPPVTAVGHVGDVGGLPEEEAYARYGVAAINKLIRGGQYK